MSINGMAFSGGAALTNQFLIMFLLYHRQSP